MKVKFLVVVENGISNYSAYSPDLPGCIATGRSVEETLDEMRSAIDFHLEGMAEKGEPMPLPRSLSSYIQDTDEISADDLITSLETDLPQLAVAWHKARKRSDRMFKYFQGLKSTTTRYFSLTTHARNGLQLPISDRRQYGRSKKILRHSKI